MPAYRPAAVVMAANTVETPPPITVDRLGRLIVGPCRLWTKALDGKGYGAIGNKDFGSTKIQRTHRVAYALAHGVPLTEIDTIPELDHLCRVTFCCAADHLEPVTHIENIERGDWVSPHKDQEICLRGHEFTEANTYRYRRSDGGWGRSCRICNHNRKQATYDPIKEAARYQARKARRRTTPPTGTPSRSTP